LLRLVGEYFSDAKIDMASATCMRRIEEELPVNEKLKINLRGKT